MELHLDSAELNLIANILIEQSSMSDLGGNANVVRILLHKVLAGDLTFTPNELDGLVAILAAQKHRLHDSIVHHGDATENGDAQRVFDLLERALAHANEACAPDLASTV